MLNSCQSYLQGILNGLGTPQTQPLTAVVQPPQVADIAGGPVAYIWGGKLVAARRTAFRPQGLMSLTWDMTIAVTQAFDQDDTTAVSAFPLVLDQIMATLMTTPLQTPVVVLTDPVTDFVTQLLAIGENYTLDYESLRTTGTAGEGLWVYVADIMAQLKEEVQFLPGSYYNPTT